MYSAAFGLRSELEVLGKQAPGAVFCLQAWQYVRAVFLAIDFSGGTLGYLTNSFGKVLFS